MKAFHRVIALLLLHQLATPFLLSETLDLLGDDQWLSENDLFSFFTESTHDTRAITLQKQDLAFSHYKPWTVIIYMAADNDLRNYSIRNIKQMLQLGSNDHCNIVVHLDIKIAGNHKITQRYYIEKNNIIYLNAHDPATQRMDSGDPQTLISFCRYTINHFPAHRYALIFWNHGSGPLDPVGTHILNPAELYSFNPDTGKLELDRTIGYFDLLKHINKETHDRGVCWDGTTGNYLTNKKLDFALKEICCSVLKKKFDIIAFDTCFMMHIEVAKLVEHYATLMIGSQEAEPAWGWCYNEALIPFTHGLADLFAISAHIVNAYKETYHDLTDDYTQSAIRLDTISLLEKNIDIVAQILLECLAIQKNSTVKNNIRASSHRSLCTSFDEPSYKDIDHFYTNLLSCVDLFEFTNHSVAPSLKLRLKNELIKGRTIIKKTVFANHAGKNLSKATGLSIYFPEKTIHHSYLINPFCTHTRWGRLLQICLK